MKRANELVTQSADELDTTSTASGRHARLHEPRPLPYRHAARGLKVKRRAAEIYSKLRQEQGNNAIQPHQLMDWLSVYAMAVNEENAAEERWSPHRQTVRRASSPPTIRYYLDHCLGATTGHPHLLLAAAAIGVSSSTMPRSQARKWAARARLVSASAMAAAASVPRLGGSNEQVGECAEIAPRASSRYDM